MGFLIEGGKALSGSVHISGAKNAVLPLMAAAILVKGQVKIQNTPQLDDVFCLMQVLESLGCNTELHKNLLTINSSLIDAVEPDPEMVSRMRASMLVLGALLAVKGEVLMPMPGGCAIGNRPIDLHLKGLAQMGARMDWDEGRLRVTTPRGGLLGCRIYLDYPSVGATENLMMAAVKARGETIIENSALEPEIADLAGFLRKAGAHITGEGTSILKIRGDEDLAPITYQVIPDRVEAGTFMLAGAITGGAIKLKPVCPEHLKAVTAKLRECGVKIKEGKQEIEVVAPREGKAINIKTMPYPGFPTDMQPQFMAYLSVAKGTSVITETVFENRFMQVPEVLRMGAQIKTEGRTAIIYGTRKLFPATVMAPDLRAGAALVLAALRAEGTTVVECTEHIDRGYESLQTKLSLLGAKIERITAPVAP
ncbi:MAG: UDP-N-acetylglucosamine 1-carboxyvinyltransferase [Methylocystaceae bacterium]